MRKIGIFHSIPTESELQKNYLFFDEIQTSIKFLETTFKTFDELKPLKGRSYSYLISRIEKLAEQGVIVTKEDIENRILPQIGSFDSKRIDQELEKETNVPEEKAVIKYFSTLKNIRREYRLDIIGSSICQNLNHNIGSGLITSLLSSNHSLKNSQLVKAQALNKVLEGAEIYSRAASGLLNSYFNDNVYVPILNRNEFSRSGFENIIDNRMNKVIDLVINNFPIPAEGINWEKIIEFKNDENAMYKLRNLRLWISELSSSTEDMSVANDKLQQLLYEYEQNLKFHKIKYTHTGLKAILVPTVEVLENMIKLNFTKAVKVLFDLSQNSIAMLEEERKIKGREIAYIHEMKQKFK